jgi:hypothetical protein
MYVGRNRVDTSTTRSLDLNYSKKLRNTVCSRLSFCHPTILLFCPGAPKPWLFIEIPLDNVYSPGFNFSLAVRHFVRNMLWQKCWGSRKRSRFYEALSLTPVLHVQHTTPLQDTVYCVRVSNFSILACVVMGRVKQRFTKSSKNYRCSLTFVLCLCLDQCYDHDELICTKTRGNLITLNTSIAVISILSNAHGAWPMF